MRMGQLHKKVAVSSRDLYSYFCFQGTRRLITVLINILAKKQDKPALSSES